MSEEELNKVFDDVAAGTISRQKAAALIADAVHRAQDQLAELEQLDVFSR